MLHLLQNNNKQASHRKGTKPILGNNAKVVRHNKLVKVSMVTDNCIVMFTCNHHLPQTFHRLPAWSHFMIVTSSCARPSRSSASSAHLENTSRDRQRGLCPKDTCRSEGECTSRRYSWAAQLVRILNGGIDRNSRRGRDSRVRASIQHVKDVIQPVRHQTGYICPPSALGCLCHPKAGRRCRSTGIPCVASSNHPSTLLISRANKIAAATSGDLRAKAASIGVADEILIPLHRTAQDIRLPR